MKNIRPCLFALFLTNLCLHLSSGAYVLYQFCGTTGNYTANSTYSSNLETLFTSFSTAVAEQGFHKNTIGAAPDQIYGLALCRGDMNSSICGFCLSQSFQDVMNICPYYKEATIYYDFCLLSYSSQQFLNSTDNLNQFYMWNPENVTVRFKGWDPSDNTVRNYYNNVVKTLLSSTSDQAAYNSRKHFCTGVINITGSLPLIMGLSQCTPDLSNNDCRACLEDFINFLLRYFDGRQGGRILGVRCNLRYEIYSFFSGNPDKHISGTSIIPSPPASGNQPTQPPPMNSPSSTIKERCIHVALLRVQENPVDRPTMSDVIVFLTTESKILPEPKQPAYFNVRETEETVGSFSINYVTLTNPEVR